MTGAKTEESLLQGSKKHAKWEDSAQNTWGFVSGGLKSPGTCPQG